MSDATETELVEPIEEETLEVEPEENVGLNKALDTYRKLIEKNEGKEPLTEKEQEALEKRIKEIEQREVVETVVDHEPEEIRNLHSGIIFFLFAGIRTGHSLGDGGKNGEGDQSGKYTGGPE